MEKKKRVVLQMEGGLGKQVALTSLLPYFHERYQQTIVLSSYPQVFESNPMVYRNISHATPFAYQEYFQEADDIYFACGYRESDFRKRRIHLVESACRSIGIEYQPDTMKPNLFLSETEEEALATLKQQIGNYLIVQFHGGKAPGTPLNKNVMAKDVPLPIAHEIVQKIRTRYPKLTIINFALPDELEIAGAAKVDLSARLWMGLVRDCETFVAIDSSLQHMSAPFEKKGIVLWGATDPKMFGWEHNVNMENFKCPLADYHCTRPYFVPSVDIKVDGQSWECPDKQCIKFDPDEIVKEVEELLGDKEFSGPTIDLTSTTPQETKFVPQEQQQ